MGKRALCHGLHDWLLLGKDKNREINLKTKPSRQEPYCPHASSPSFRYTPGHARATCYFAAAPAVSASLTMAPTLSTISFGTAIDSW